ncbi:hypothetical protein ABPG74_006387 [Tetrahymena malaccensis]
MDQNNQYINNQNPQYYQPYHGGNNGQDLQQQPGQVQQGTQNYFQYMEQQQQQQYSQIPQYPQQSSPAPQNPQGQPQNQQMYQQMYSRNQQMNEAVPQYQRLQGTPSTFQGLPQNQNQQIVNAIPQYQIGQQVQQPVMHHQSQQQVHVQNKNLPPSQQQNLQQQIPINKNQPQSAINNMNNNKQLITTPNQINQIDKSIIPLQKQPSQQQKGIQQPYANQFQQQNSIPPILNQINTTNLQSGKTPQIQKQQSNASQPIINQSPAQLQQQQSMQKQNVPQMQQQMGQKQNQIQQKQQPQFNQQNLQKQQVQNIGQQQMQNPAQQQIQNNFKQLPNSNSIVGQVNPQKQSNQFQSQQPSQQQQIPQKQINQQPQHLNPNKVQQQPQQQQQHQSQQIIKPIEQSQNQLLKPQQFSSQQPLQQQQQQLQQNQNPQKQMQQPRMGAQQLGKPQQGVQKLQHPTLSSQSSQQQQFNIQNPQQQQRIQSQQQAQLKQPVQGQKPQQQHPNQQYQMMGNQVQQGGQQQKVQQNYQQFSQQTNSQQQPQSLQQQNQLQQQQVQTASQGQQQQEQATVTQRQNRLDSGENLFQFNQMNKARQDQKPQQEQGQRMNNIKKGQNFDIKKFDSVLDNTTMPKLFNLTLNKAYEINQSLPSGYSLEPFYIAQLKFNSNIYGESANDYGEAPQKKVKTEENLFLQMSISQLAPNAPMKRELIQLMNIKPSANPAVNLITPIVKKPSASNSNLNQGSSLNSTPQKSQNDLSKQNSKIQTSTQPSNTTQNAQQQSAIKENNQTQIQSQKIPQQAVQSQNQQQANKQPSQIQKSGQEQNPNAQIQRQNPQNQAQNPQNQNQNPLNKNLPIKQQTQQPSQQNNQNPTLNKNLQQQQSNSTQNLQKPLNQNSQQQQQKGRIQQPGNSSQNQTASLQPNNEGQQNKSQTTNQIPGQVQNDTQNKQILNQKPAQINQQNAQTNQLQQQKQIANQQPQNLNNNNNNQNQKNQQQKPPTQISQNQNQQNQLNTQEKNAQISSNQSSLKIQLQLPQQQQNTELQQQQQQQQQPQQSQQINQISRQNSQQNLNINSRQSSQQSLQQLSTSQNNISNSQQLQASQQNNPQISKISSQNTQQQAKEKNSSSIIKINLNPLQQSEQASSQKLPENSQKQAVSSSSNILSRGGSSQNINIPGQQQNKSQQPVQTQTKSAQPLSPTSSQPIVVSTIIENLDIEDSNKQANAQHQESKQPSAASEANNNDQQNLSQKPQVDQNKGQSVNVPKKSSLPPILLNSIQSSTNQPSKQNVPILSSLPPMLRQQMENQNKNLVDTCKKEHQGQENNATFEPLKETKMEIEENVEKSNKIPNEFSNSFVKEEDINSLNKSSDQIIQDQNIKSPILPPQQPVGQRPKSIDFPRQPQPNSQLLLQASDTSNIQSNNHETTVKSEETKIFLKIPDIKPSKSQLTSPVNPEPANILTGNNITLKFASKIEEEVQNEARLKIEETNAMEIEQPIEQVEFQDQNIEHNQMQLNTETPYFQTNIEQQTNLNVKIEPFQDLHQMIKQENIQGDQSYLDQVQKGSQDNSLIITLPNNQIQQKIEADPNLMPLNTLPPNMISSGPLNNDFIREKKKKMEKKNISQEDQKAMSEIIQRLTKNKNSEPFKKLSSLAKNPDYLKIIKEPMDLQTVETNIKKKYYSNIDEMAVDVNKIFANAKLYNKEDTDIYKKAVELEEYFKKKYQKSPLSNEINNLQKKVDKLGKELKEYHTYGGRFFYRENKKIQKQAFMERSMSLDEKTQLAKNIRKLPKEYWIGIWEIMTDKQFCIADKQKIEFDLDSTTPKQCRRLERYVKAKLTSIQKAREKKNKKLEKAQNKVPSEYVDPAKLEKLDTDSSYITESDDSMKDPDEDGGD